MAQNTPGFNDNADSREFLPWILGIIAVIALLIWNFISLAD